MIALLRDLRKLCAIGFVGGSDMVKILEQLGSNGKKLAYQACPLPDHVARSHRRIIRLCVRREWTYCIQAWETTRIPVIHQVRWRRTIQEAGFLHSPLYRRHGYSDQAVCKDISDTRNMLIQAGLEGRLSNSATE